MVHSRGALPTSPHECPISYNHDCRGPWPVQGAISLPITPVPSSLNAQGGEPLSYCEEEDIPEVGSLP